MSGATSRAGVVRVVAGPVTAPGFALAGVAADAVPPGADAAAALARAAAREGTSVVLIEERLYDALPAESRKRWERSVAPVVVPFPSPVAEEAGAPAERIVELIRRAIGYRVRLR
ncbi:MAG TPA: V-type ATP synthase subunit F [Gemmatimonadales bacterium]|nr:V-type ATP synthase subunit F [Gemmatimonadales bacterium]